MKKLLKLVFVFGMLINIVACTNQTEAEQAVIQVQQDEEILQEQQIELTEPEEHVSEEQEELQITEIDYKTIRPYEVGQIMIIMYHGIVEENPPSSYQRTIEGFKSDLQNLYDNGFRLMSLRDLIHNEISIEAGYTPVVFTFDDGIDTSFSLTRNEEGELVPTENSAVYLLNEFAKKHPDFGNTATFFINGNMDFFRGEGTKQERLQYLIDNGHDIGNHTYTHKSLSRQTAEEIQEEVGKVDKLIRELVDYIPESISYPLGERPLDDELKKFVLVGEHEGHSYEYKIALREGASGSASAPNRKNYDPLNVPRVRGSDDEETDLGWYLRFYEENPIYRYVSDGNPNRIAVPEIYQDNIDFETAKNKEIFIYSFE